MVTGTNGEIHNTTNFSLVRYLLLWRGMRMKYIFISRTTKKVVKERHLYSVWDSKSMKKYAIYKIIFLLFLSTPKHLFTFAQFGFLDKLFWLLIITILSRMPTLKYSWNTKIGRSCFEKEQGCGSMLSNYHIHMIGLPIDYHTLEYTFYHSFFSFNHLQLLDFNHFLMICNFFHSLKYIFHWSGEN